MRLRIKHRALRVLGWIVGHNHDWLEAPNHHATLRIARKDYDHPLVCVLNSESPSDQVWLGQSNKWIWFYSGRDFRKMAAWALWRWAWGDWFGLKTRLFMWALRLSTRSRRGS